MRQSDTAEHAFCCVYTALNGDLNDASDICRHNMYTHIHTHACFSATERYDLTYCVESTGSALQPMVGDTCDVNSVLAGPCMFFLQ